MSIEVKMPPDPIWRSIKSQNGIIAYNALWLVTYALQWFFTIDNPEVTLNYFSIEEMPFNTKEVSE